jgi:hypothetical protein
MDGRISVITTTELKTARKTLFPCYHSGEKPIPGIPAGNPGMGIKHWQPFDNCFILFPFKGTRRINQASAGTEVWERPLDHLALPPLKHPYIGRLEAPFDFRISR